MSSPITISLPVSPQADQSLFASLSSQIQAGSRDAGIVADAAAIQNPTAAEIAILVALAREASTRGVDFRIINPSSVLVETLRHLRLDREFGISASASP